MKAWIIWGIIIFLQNFGNTFVSRARNSASLRRHAIAAMLSNGIFVSNQMMMFGVFFDNLAGHHGRTTQVVTGIFYTLFTIVGSLVAHKWSLKTEHGSARVGAYKDTAWQKSV